MIPEPRGVAPAPDETPKTPVKWRTKQTRD